MKKTNTKRALGMSLISLLACGLMFAGTTYAWFTDSVEVNDNKIQTGTLKVDLEMLEGSNWNSLRGSIEAVFAGGLWEPGYTDYAVLKVENEGNLAARWELSIVNKGLDTKRVAEVIDVYVLKSDSEIAAPTSIKEAGYEKVGTLADVLLEGSLDKGTFDAKTAGTAKYIGIMLHMQEEAGNEYQGADDVLFDIKLNAYQLAQEQDGFGNSDYDDTWDVMAATEFADSYETDKVLDIATPAEFALFSKTVSEGNSFKGVSINLNSDVDLMNIDWTPIGNSTTKFQGNFNGNGHTIKNLKIDNRDTSYQGLFGFTTGGKIGNFTVENASVAGRLGVGVVSGSPYTSSFENINVTGLIQVEGMSYVGGIFGRNAYANISNITVNADSGSYVKADSVEGGVAYRTYVGGLVGFIGEGGHTLSNISSNLDVYGSTCDIGGITGIAHYGNTFINVSCSGNVYLTNDSTEEDEVLEMGGIAGVWNNGGSDVSFIGCEFTGTLNATLNGVAYTNFANNGLVGKAYSTSGTGKLIIKAAEQIDTTVNVDSLLGESATGDVVVKVGNNGNMVWTTGSGHGTTPFGDENIDSVTIIGNGAENSTLTFEGAGVGPVRANKGGVLTIKDVTVVDNTVSYAEDSWEFTYLEIGYEDSEVVFENVVFESGISLDGAKATFINCTFKSPNANEYSVWVSQGNVSFENCTFLGTRGLKMHEAYGSEIKSVTVSNCTFENIEKKPGIAIGTLNADTKVVVENSKFINCQAGDQGLFIYETDTDVTTFNFTLTNNVVE